MSLLETHALSRRFAGLVAVDTVDLAIPQGGIHAVIGPNGAGKTTFFNLISGLTPPSAGTIHFAGHNVTLSPVSRRAGLGMARTFQNIRVFTEMTLLENVLTGLHARLDISLGAALFRLPSFRSAERDAVIQARAALGLAGLADRAEALAGSLAYGDQRRLEIARALAGRPSLLLLDEPAAGMNPAETEALAALVRQIAASGTTVLLVEHDMGFVMELCDSVAVLNFGRLIFRGTPHQVRSEPAVIEAYLGARLAEKLRAHAK